jgi:hypothetical protein
METLQSPNSTQQIPLRTKPQQKERQIRLQSPGSRVLQNYPEAIRCSSILLQPEFQNIYCSASGQPSVQEYKVAACQDVTLGTLHHDIESIFGLGTHAGAINGLGVDGTGSCHPAAVEVAAVDEGSVVIFAGVLA